MSPPLIASIDRSQILIDDDMIKWRGKLRGRIVLTQPARTVRLLEGDVVDHVQPDELKQAATVAAAFAYLAAMRDGKLSRKPVVGGGR